MTCRFLTSSRKGGGFVSGGIEEAEVVQAKSGLVFKLRSWQMSE